VGGEVFLIRPSGFVMDHSKPADHFDGLIGLYLSRRGLIGLRSINRDGCERTQGVELALSRRNVRHADVIVFHSLKKYRFERDELFVFCRHPPLEFVHHIRLSAAMPFCRGNAPAIREHAADPYHA
jgi:hypothetical protein